MQQKRQVQRAVWSVIDFVLDGASDVRNSVSNSFSNKTIYSTRSISLLIQVYISILEGFVNSWNVERLQVPEAEKSCLSVIYNSYFMIFFKYFIHECTYKVICIYIFFKFYKKEASHKVGKEQTLARYGHLMIHCIILILFQRILITGLYPRTLHVFTSI